MRVEHLYGPTTMDLTSVMGEHGVIGYPKEARIRDEQRQPGHAERGDPVTIGAGCVIGNQVVIGEDVRIGDDCVIEDRVRIGYGCVIGRGVRLAYGAYVCDRVRVGVAACVAGFVCDGSTIGDRSTVMGQLVHEYTRPHRGWWEVDEPAPEVGPDSVVGYGATVVGGVRIGARSYVAAGATVTKDVPIGVIVTGVNVHTPTDRWRGSRLRDWIGHWSS